MSKISMNVQMKNPEYVKSLIKKQGLSIYGFCRKIGISQPSLSRILNGNHDPYPSLAKKIAKGLNKNIDDIFFTSSARK